ncbi:hypothetical protein LC586_32535 [Nostoc sp. CHAB 5714]|uniref:Novel STAND NTPase 1 domain-containing protein n=1 Tax=Nostoc favosum CHAB5714 TaxID=2780399 RepID=A0ABS8IHM7_9NOSO|nr:hypothetical protein [Nostoc favosum]MCC5603773.1 hypothetical protein [Nostoc favosum CHAB5714]
MIQKTPIAVPTSMDYCRFEPLQKLGCSPPIQGEQGENSTDIQRRLDEMVLEVDLRHDETKLAQFINDIITKRHLVLIADQFEELYTLAPPEERQPFLNALIYAINHARRFTLVLTLRADFMAMLYLTVLLAMLCSREFIILAP